MTLRRSSAELLLKFLHSLTANRAAHTVQYYDANTPNTNDSTSIDRENFYYVAVEHIEDAGLQEYD